MLALMEIKEYSKGESRACNLKRRISQPSDSFYSEKQRERLLMIIYKATNKINQKVYIGKSIYNLSTRKSQHKYDSLNKRTNHYFCNALRKHGIDNFKWETIDTAKTEKELNLLEQLYIEEYRLKGKDYNLTDGGEGVSGLKVSKETKRKLSESHKGHKPTEETLKKMSKAQKNVGLKGKERGLE